MLIKVDINNLKSDNSKISEKCAKLSEYFTSDGKGGIIQILGEPLFPLRTTIEFIIKEFSGQKVTILKAIQNFRDK